MIFVLFDGDTLGGPRVRPRDPRRKTIVGRLYIYIYIYIYAYIYVDYGMSTFARVHGLRASLDRFAGLVDRRLMCVYIYIYIHIHIHIHIYIYVHLYIYTSIHPGSPGEVAMQHHNAT